MANDTLADVQKNYFEIAFTNDNTREILLQAKSYKNPDSTITLAIVGIHSDQQCQFYHTYFFEYSCITDSITSIPNNVILPKTNIELFLKGTLIPNTVSKYLQQIKKENPDGNTTLNAVLDALYNVRYIISSKDQFMTATLSLCDFILSNIKVKKSDRQILETHLKSIF